MKELNIDPRYAITLYANGKHVVRFCGDVVGEYRTRKLALVAMLNNHLERLENPHIDDRLLISNTNDVQMYVWYTSDCVNYRVVYGAEVKDFYELREATTFFSDCMYHSLNCEGVE